MSFARSCAGAVALVLATTTVEPVAFAGTPTGTPASNPAHPVWNSNKTRVPKTKFRQSRKFKATKAKVRVKGKKHSEEPPMHEVPPPPLQHPTPWIHQGDPAAQPAPLASPEPRPPEELDAAVGLERHQRAEQAYQSAQALLARGKHNEAIEQLDMATELDPSWSAPVLLRAETFGALALRYEPSQTFLSAQAADLQRLLALEPNVEVAARSQQLVALRARSQDAQRKEERRRRMVKPALIVGSFSVLLIVGGALLASSFYPSTDIDAIGQRRYVYGGIAMAAVGVAMAPAAITLGVLAGRQNRRDHAARELSAYTGRPQPTLGLSPRIYQGGGGMGLSLRF
jgi:hypothetical protein